MTNQEITAGQPRRPHLTKTDIEGPYYLAGAPDREDIAQGAQGEALLLTGIVYGLLADDRLIPLINGEAEIDFWQANTDGVYDNQDFENPNQAPPGHVYLFRGKVKTNENGEYRLVTIKPGHYPIGEGKVRTAHIHAKVRIAKKTIWARLKALATNAVRKLLPLPAAKLDPKEVLTTQLYFPEEKEYNEKDGWYSPILEITDKEVNENGVTKLIGKFDFVVPVSA